jgi:hypothetical protein
MIRAPLLDDRCYPIRFGHGHESPGKGDDRDTPELTNGGLRSPRYILPASTLDV